MAKRLFPDYTWWLEYNGVWELKQAANLYLGFDPDKGGTFYMVDDLLKKHDKGLILIDSETIWSVRALKSPTSRVEWSDVLDKDGVCKISLETFIKKRIKAGEIEKILDDDDLPSGIYFKPTEIIPFFQKHLLNSPPQDLLSALRRSNKPLIPKTYAAPKSIADHAAAYQEHLNEQIALYLKGKVRKPWASQDAEEPLISQRMGIGFHRTRFREARKKILASYPNSSKTKFSEKDHSTLRAFILKQKKGS